MARVKMGNLQANKIGGKPVGLAWGFIQPGNTTQLTCYLRTTWMNEYLKDQLSTSTHSSPLMSYNTTLHEAYKSTFQPDPDVIIPNKFPLTHHPLNNARVATNPMLVNTLFGNCSANHLVLNPAQFASLRHMIGNVGDVHTLAYLVPTDLPPPSSNQDLAKVVLPTRPLSDDARCITPPFLSPLTSAMIM